MRHTLIFDIVIGLFIANALISNTKSLSEPDASSIRGKVVTRANISPINISTKYLSIKIRMSKFLSSFSSFKLSLSVLSDLGIEDDEDDEDDDDDGGGSDDDDNVDVCENEKGAVCESGGGDGGEDEARDRERSEKLNGATWSVKPASNKSPPSNTISI